MFFLLLQNCSFLVGLLGFGLGYLMSLIWSESILKKKDDLGYMSLLDWLLLILVVVVVQNKDDS
jgi:hypothetical protein